MARKTRKRSRPASRRRSRRAAPPAFRRRSRRRRSAPVASRRRRRGGGGGGGQLLAPGRNVIDTIKRNLIPAAVIAVSTTVGAAGSGMLARRLAPMRIFAGSPMRVGGAIALLGILLAASARKVAGATGAVGSRAVQFAGIGAATYGLTQLAAALRSRIPKLPPGQNTQAAAQAAAGASQASGLGPATRVSSAARYSQLAGRR